MSRMGNIVLGFNSRKRSQHEAYSSANFYLGALIGGDYDYNFALNRQDRDTLRLAARVYGRDGGGEGVMPTTEPGLQLYSALSWTAR